ncbi:MAG: hypothetical protein OEY01_05230 [Desulfobulbaceae bacterium]|nr:hypothetical protein [Desulfobulbaceae bacterium]
MRNRPLILIFLIALYLCRPPAPCLARHDLSQHIEHLGNPYSSRYPKPEQTYARNIWDMIGFKGKIYLGAGNSSNNGPSPNAGPVPVMAYEPATKSFSSPFTTNEEQIDQFYLFDDVLYLPGHDPQENWNLGNLYLTSDGRKWQKKRTIPFAVHTYCLHLFQGQLFAGLGTANGAAIASSDNLGLNWDLSLFKATRRFNNFLEVNQRLYAADLIAGDAYRKALEQHGAKPTPSIFEYAGPQQFTPRPDLTNRELFPDTSPDRHQTYKIMRPRSLGDKALYLGGYAHNDHQFIPFGLYLAESLAKDDIRVKKIRLADNALPWDIHQSTQYVYVLANRKMGDQFEVSVYRSDNLDEWQELFFFSAPTFARSFTLAEGIFYFSLGGEIADPRHWKPEELAEQTGEILKLDLFSVQ